MDVFDPYITKAWATFSVKGQHIASGASPTDKKVTISAITIDRIANGKFVEEWERYDTLGLMQQLGLIPTQAKV